MRTCRNNHSASWICIRMQPWRPSSRSTPRRACRGSRHRARSGPSSASRAGCSGPGGTGFSPAAHGELGGYHQGFLHLTTIRKRAERCRVDRLSGRNREDSPGPHPAIEMELVGAAADHDHRPEVRPGGRRRGDLLPQLQRAMLVRDQRPQDRRLCTGAVESETDDRLRQSRVGDFGGRAGRRLVARRTASRERPRTNALELD